MDDEDNQSSSDTLKRKLDEHQQQQQQQPGDENKKLKTNNQSDQPIPSSSSSSSNDSLEEIKIDSIELNSLFLNELDELKKSYKESTELKSEHYTTIINKPFKVVQFHNFIENDQLILPQILHAANTIPLQRRSNDLYSLQQSRDLKNYPSLKNIVEFFQTKVKSFLENLTGLQLNNNVALTFSKYEQNGNTDLFWQTEKSN